MPTTQLFPRTTPMPISELAAETCSRFGAGQRTCQATITRILGQDVDILNGNSSGEKGQISLREAHHFLQRLGAGHSIPEDKPYISMLQKSISYHFFHSSPLDEHHITLGPIKVTVYKCADGDTCRAKIGYDGHEFEIKFRFAGIDTPESVDNPGMRNPKLTGFMDYISTYFQLEHGVWASDRNMVRVMIRDRIMYSGLLASAVTKGVTEWANLKEVPFTLDLAFRRRPIRPDEISDLTWEPHSGEFDQAAYCSVLEIVDVYERMILGVRVGASDERRDLLGDFIEGELPNIMAKKGQEYYDFYHDQSGPLADRWTRKVYALTPQGQRLLGIWRNHSERRSVWEALSPDTLPKPGEIFSPENCKKLAEAWKRLVVIKPGLRNDVQAMLVFLGLAYTYPKYRVNFTESYLKMEKLVIRGVIQDREGQFIPHGLNKDPIFLLMRPNPEFSPLFAHPTIGRELSRGWPLVPADCCEELERSGGDTYDHCP